MSKKQSFFELVAGRAMVIPSGASSLVQRDADRIMWSRLWLAALFLLACRYPARWGTLSHSAQRMVIQSARHSPLSVFAAGF